MISAIIAGTDEMLNIDIPLTAAIMPFMPSAQVDEKKALEKGKEVIIHLPMEPEVGKRSWLGPKGITTDLSDDQIKSMVEEAFQIIPSAKGMNNHMGSKAIKDERIMKNIFTILKEKDRFFLDSKTTSDATACRVASESKVKYYKRDIFLDNEKSVASIEKQLDKLTDVALKNGYAIGIGHVGVEGGKITADAIKNKMPEMKKRGIEFVFLSQIP